MPKAPGKPPPPCSIARPCRCCALVLATRTSPTFCGGTSGCGCRSGRRP